MHAHSHKNTVTHRERDTHTNYLSLLYIKTIKNTCTRTQTQSHRHTKSSTHTIFRPFTLVFSIFYTFFTKIHIYILKNPYTTTHNQTYHHPHKYKQTHQIHRNSVRSPKYILDFIHSSYIHPKKSIYNHT